jgi:alkylmercury lyase
MFAGFGSEVTLITRGPSILPGYEPEIVESLTEILREEGLQIETSAQVRSVGRSGDGVALVGKLHGSSRTFTAEKLLVARGKQATHESTGRKPMPHLSLDALARRLSEQLQCEQEELCLPILQQVSKGKPLPKATLTTSLSISQDELDQRLTRLPDTDFDREGQIVGWGVTLVPTRHRFQIDGKALYTWCAFDTVLFPPTLGQTAQVHSTCPVTGQPISFVATPEGVVMELTPVSAVLSLIVPAERRDCVRSTFCEQSLFFRSEQAASRWLSLHPEALILSIEEAAHVGKLVADARFSGKEQGNV